MHFEFTLIKIFLFLDQNGIGQRRRSTGVQIGNQVMLLFHNVPKVVINEIFNSEGEISDMVIKENHSVHLYDFYF